MHDDVLFTLDSAIKEFRSDQTECPYIKKTIMDIQEYFPISGEKGGEYDIE